MGEAEFHVREAAGVVLSQPRQARELSDDPIWCEFQVGFEPIIPQAMSPVLGNFGISGFHWGHSF